MMDDDAPGSGGEARLPGSTKGQRSSRSTSRPRARSIQTATLGARLEHHNKLLTRREWDSWTREERNFFRRGVISTLVPPPRQDPVFYMHPMGEDGPYQLECLTGNSSKPCTVGR